MDEIVIGGARVGGFAHIWVRNRKIVGGPAKQNAKRLEQK